MQAERNNKGIALEKEGRVEEAIILYEANIAERFVGSHPYNRLSVIYHKQKSYENERRVLLVAIDVFQSLKDKGSPRTDIEPKLNKFKERLDKLNSNIAKNGT